MNPLEVLEAELKVLKSKRSAAYRQIEMLGPKIEDLEEAIEHMIILPKYQKEGEENE